MSWPFILSLLLVALGLFAAVYWVSRPSGINQLKAHPRPAAGYAEALSRIAALQVQEGEGIHPDCHTQLLAHGARAERALVLIHGYTSCPQQFVPLGQRFYEQGQNVLIARLPRHGQTDRLNRDHGGLLAAELAAYADEVVDIAAGLGERITLVGLSAGGVTTAWAAQTRPDLDRAVIVSPAFGFRALPMPLTVPLMNLVLLLPDAFDWWEPELREQGGQPYTYPQRSRHALANILRLGFATLALAARQPPAARHIVMVTNANDNAVDGEAARRMARAWRAAGAPDVVEYEYPAALKLPHDLIDPAHPDGNVDVSYPKLMELIAG
jgi:carboxylesterase